MAEEKVKVTEVIDALLEGNQDPKFDINNDGKVNIDDVTAAIDRDLGIDPNRFEVKGVEFHMVDVVGGTFTMGSPNSESGRLTTEGPQHQVTLTAYKIGQTPVTQELWQAVMGKNPSINKGDLQRPVEWVRWTEAQEFIAKLNALTGKSFRLPTEAEWEYAARGGNKSQGYLYAGSNKVAEVAWSAGNSENVTHPVGQLKANELGIYDMSGNVAEWCADWYGRYSADAVTNPTGPNSGQFKIYRGGGYQAYANEQRIAYRYMRTPDTHLQFLGLRLAL